MTGSLASTWEAGEPHLVKAVNSVPAVESLCTQAASLTNQFNAVGAALGGIVLGGVIPLGLELTVPGLSSLPAYACP
jgi:hypothetical protein